MLEVPLVVISLDGNLFCTVDFCLLSLQRLLRRRFSGCMLEQLRSLLPDTEVLEVLLITFELL